MLHKNTLLCWAFCLSLSHPVSLSLTHSCALSRCLSPAVSLPRVCSLPLLLGIFLANTDMHTHTHTHAHTHTTHSNNTPPVKHTHTHTHTHTHAHTHAHQGAGRGVGGVDGFDRFGTGSNLEIYSCHGRQWCLECIRVMRIHLPQLLCVALCSSVLRCVAAQS